MTDPVTEPRIRTGVADLPDQTDVLVIGLGITGTGVALDAASRGLDVVAVDAFDLAFGTSRWSSKLVHGGLRYLAKLQLGVAHESAVERGILMETTAPHLTHAMPMLLPLMSSVSRPQASLARAGFFAGDLLRRKARTTADTLPRPRRVSRTEALRMAPALRSAGLRGGLLSWDGQLEDDARLVTAVARTAVAHGADVRNHARVLSATGTSAVIRDEITGAEHTIRAKKVINATGVWAASIVDVTLKPSRGTHLVLRADTLPGLTTAVTAPIPHTSNRFVLVLPQPDGTIYVGLTDEEVEGEIPDVPEPSEAEIGFLLDVVAAAFDRPLHRSDVIGAYAGLRPLLQSEGSTSDLSREHAVLTSDTGVITIVGGKLTTYRQMAEDAVDATHLADGRCRTRNLPLVGAAPRAELAKLEEPARLVRRFGTEARAVLENARTVSGLSDEELLAPIAPTVPATLAELIFGVTHEGAVDVDDLLDRRTRVGLVPADRVLAVPAAERALQLVAAVR
ncbi:MULTISPECIES: glycerol-3-phosphate dehydrogenase/oxidase [unclassified Nocardioides]|uniref:glycerol-3-phosphate dehydrogenase/oxidase n=1 Tax=unclassified Nocardioides TaxID=2615069 RepID=UPI0006F7C1FD|nr:MULTISPECIES: glycerol-3-phosphate dehydrogenase/oxidase [unclassified Nocardioides]KQY57582.1 glycerol-3-phosphate dehydrogenase [Nocardioides sp. Root140]KQZ76049.1 glycerol-3-phosphate dehydrogenase [Nocardioides sp. Root151]KRF15122.1 glycerol-3-phosphate dehydrogenase [Nocardioides sp. Soil796]